MLMIRILNLNLNLDSINGLIEPDFSDPVYLRKVFVEYEAWKKNNTYNKSLSGFFLVP